MTSEQIGPVAPTFPDLTRAEWGSFRSVLPDEPGLGDSYNGWLREQRKANEVAHALQPLVTISIDYEGWQSNDLSHIAMARQRVCGEPDIRSIVEDLRIFHEHAPALGSAYAVAEGLEAVMWIRHRHYAWAKPFYPEIDWAIDPDLARQPKTPSKRARIWRVSMIRLLLQK